MSSPIPTIIAAFTFFYHHSKAALFENLPPLFNIHTSQDIYLSLLHLNTVCPAHILKAALLERAKEDISRIHTLQKVKEAAWNLSERKHIDQVTWDYLENMEAELIDEIKDVQSEASGLGGEDWKDIIMIQANEYFLKRGIIKSLENLGLDLNDNNILLNHDVIEEEELRDEQKRTI